METEAIHHIIEEGEDATSYAENEEEEDASDDITGTEDDGSEEDDFEFKDLEKEIYGRLGGPPPELQEAMTKVVDQKEMKSSNIKEKKQSTDYKEGPKVNRTALQELTSTANAKTTDDTKEKEVKENLLPTQATSVKPIPSKENPVTISAETKEIATSKNTDHVNQTTKTTKKEESAKKEKDEDEAPMDECGCTVM